MAFRLNEIIGSQYQSRVLDSNKLQLVRSTQYGEPPIAKTNMFLYSSLNKIIFEYKENYALDLISLCAKGPDVLESGLGTSNLLAFYRLGHLDQRLFGYTTGSKVVLSNYPTHIAGDVYHILLDLYNKNVDVYQVSSQLLVYRLYFGGFVTKLSDSMCLGFYSGSGNSDNLTHPIINPDVESFKYKPFIEHDLDLYSAVLDLPYTPKWDYTSSMTSKNIISLL